MYELEEENVEEDGVGEGGVSGSLLLSCVSRKVAAMIVRFKTRFVTVRSSRKKSLHGNTPNFHTVCSNTRLGSNTGTAPVVGSL